MPLPTYFLRGYYPHTTGFLWVVVTEPSTARTLASSLLSSYLYPTDDGAEQDAGSGNAYFLKFVEYGSRSLDSEGGYEKGEDGHFLFTVDGAVYPPIDEDSRDAAWTHITPFDGCGDCPNVGMFWHYEPHYTTNTTGFLPPGELAAEAHYVEGTYTTLDPIDTTGYPEVENRLLVDVSGGFRVKRLNNENRSIKVYWLLDGTVVRQWDVFVPSVTRMPRAEDGDVSIEVLGVDFFHPPTPLSDPPFHGDIQYSFRFRDAVTTPDQRKCKIVRFTGGSGGGGLDVSSFFPFDDGEHESWDTVYHIGISPNPLLPGHTQDACFLFQWLRDCNPLGADHTEDAITGRFTDLPNLAPMYGVHVQCRTDFSINVFYDDDYCVGRSEDQDEDDEAQELQQVYLLSLATVFIIAVAGLLVFVNAVESAAIAAQQADRLRQAAAAARSYRAARQAEEAARIAEEAKAAAEASNFEKWREIGNAAQQQANETFQYIGR